MGKTASVLLKMFISGYVILYRKHLIKMYSVQFCSCVKYPTDPSQILKKEHGQYRNSVYRNKAYSLNN